MIRFFLRLLGLLCLAAAFLLIIYDGTKSIAGNVVAITSVRALWETITEERRELVRRLLLERLSLILAESR